MMRTPQAKPNGYLIDQVDVKEVKENEYTVSLLPHRCGHDFPLPEIEGAEVSILPQVACLILETVNVFQR